MMASMSFAAGKLGPDFSTPEVTGAAAASATTFTATLRLALCAVKGAGRAAARWGRETQLRLLDLNSDAISKDFDTI